MSVQGIGAKASLAILGAVGGEGVGRAVALGDWGTIASAKGVGPKIAQRVVNELKDKAPAVMAMGGSLPEALAETLSDAVIEPMVAPAPSGDGAAQAEALSALANLGYGPGEAATAVAQAAGAEPGADTAGLIRAALKLLAPAG